MGPAEFWRRALDLVARAIPSGQTARDFGINELFLRNWINRGVIGSGHRAGIAALISGELDGADDRRFIGRGRRLGRYLESIHDDLGRDRSEDPEITRAMCGQTCASL